MKPVWLAVLIVCQSWLARVQASEKENRGSILKEIIIDNEYWRMEVDLRAQKSYLIDKIYIKATVSQKERNGQYTVLPEGSMLQTFVQIRFEDHLDQTNLDFENYVGAIKVRNVAVKSEE